MAGKTVNFNAQSTLSDCQLETIAKWLSCNGEVWGVGPTVVFASAAALFLYHELEATIFVTGDHAQISLHEKTLVSTMVLGMLALMVHLWVCAMRFFQYYLDTLIRDSPNMLLEMTTAGLLGGGQSELAALGPLTRFLRQQQPQIHITVCWFLSLCYADYVRKHYCQRFNMPYLEQWQSELQDRASRGVSRTMQKVNSFVGAVHQRLRGYAPPVSEYSDAQTHTYTYTHTGMALAAYRCSRGRNSEPIALDSHGLPGRLLGAPNDPTSEAIEKLRAYITDLLGEQLRKLRSKDVSITDHRPTGHEVFLQRATDLRSQQCRPLHSLKEARSPTGDAFRQSYLYF